MRKAKMRIGSILLVVAMLMTLLPVGVFAAEETLEKSLMDAEKFCEEFQKAMETEAGPTWLQVGNAGLSYKAAADAVAALEEGEEKTAAEVRLKAVKAIYDKVKELDMSGKTDGFLETSGKPVDLHAALVYFTNLKTLNLSNNNLTDVGWLVKGSDSEVTSAFKNLKNLDLSDNSGITEKAYGSLTYVSLETLNLSNTGITTIAPLTTHGGTPAIASSLVSLDVSGTAWSNFAELWKENAPSMSALKNLTAQNLKKTITDIGALAEITRMDGFDASQYHWDLSGSNFASADDARAQQFTTVREAFAKHPTNFAAPNMQGVANLTAAILEDHAKSNPIAKEDLADNYVVTSEQNNELVNVTITADNLRKHTNGEKQEGYWVGFALTAPKGAEKVKYGFDDASGVTASKTIALEPNVTEAGDSGIAFYIDASAEKPKLYAKVQWLDNKENPISTIMSYQVNIDGVTMLIEDSNIKAATLRDTTGAVADDYLYDKGSYDVVVTKKVANNYYDVAITAKNLRKHNNAEAPSSFAYWVGFAVPAEDGTSHFKCAWDQTIGEDAKANAKEEIFAGKYGVAPYLKADRDDGAFFTVQWMSNASTPKGDPVTYKVDLSGVTLNTAATTISGVTVMENDAVSPAISAVVNGNQINLSGLAATEPSTTLKLVLNTNAGGKVEKEITLTYAEGTGFSISDDNKVTVAGKEYTIAVFAISAMPKNVEVEAGGADTKVSDTISSDDKDAVEDALGEIDVENATVVVAQAANAEITKVTSGLTEEKIEELLAKANEGKTGTPYDTIKVVAYLQVTATGYTKAGEGTELAFTLDIQPMYKVVAADADDSTTNPDKDTGISGKLNVSSTAEPVKITVGLPTGFVSDTSTTPVYVYHKNYIYATTLAGASEPYTAIFTNPHGFSAFTLKTTAGASVTDLNGQTTVYATLQDAVNAVKDGETIKLLADNQTATVAKTVTFKVDKDGKNCIIKDGYGKTVKPDANGVYTIAFYGYPDDGGSTTTPTSYGITVSTAENGTVKSSNSSAAKDATVTITVTPGEGYVLDTLTVTDKDNKTVSLTKVSDTQYTFKMPASAVTVKATFKKDEGTQPAALPFNDVSESEWFYEAVKYVYDKGMMNGVSDTSFAPYSNLTRGMIAQVLYNLEGKPAVSGSAYTDVAADQWYNGAVNWAAQKGIVTGYGDGAFGPMDNITREQMAAILYRYAQYKGYDVSAKGDLTAFTDGNTVSDWAKDATSWAVGTALFNGKGDGILDPTTTATRAEVAKILMTYCENVAK